MTQPAAVDPHGTTDTSCSMNGFTVAYRPASSACHSRSPSSSLEGSGSSSATVASAASSASITASSRLATARSTTR